MVVVVVGGGGGDVVGGGGGDVVGGEVGGGLVGAGLVGAGLFGAGLFGLAGADVGRVVVEADDGLDPGVDGGGTVRIVPALFVRLSVPFDLTVNQLFATPCPPACDTE